MELSTIVVDQFDSIASIYDKKSLVRQNYMDAIDNQIIAAVSGLQGLDVLDVGTGTGTRAKKLKNALSVNEFFVCDASLKMIQIAEEKGFDDVRLAVMPDLPYANESKDVVLCLFNAFGCVFSDAARAKTLEAFYSILKPGGYLFIDVLNRWHLGEGVSFYKSRFKVIRELLASILNQDLEYGDIIFNILDEQMKLIPGYFHSFTRKEIINMLQKAGFKIELEQIVGYDSGTIKTNLNEGQFFYVCRKV